MTSIPTVKWCKSPSVEAHMNELGFQWKHVQNYPFSKIDISASLQNNARFGAAVKDDKVLEYAGFMENGDVFPSIVVYLPKNLIIGGNHRLKAAELLGVTCADAYSVVAAEECKIREFLYTDNRHGVEDDDVDEAKMQHVLTLHRECKMPLQEACIKEFGRRDMYAKCLARAHRMHTVEQLRVHGASQHRIDEMLKGPRASILDALYQLCPAKSGGLGNAKVLVNTFRAIDDLRLSTNQAQEVIAKVKAQKTEKSQSAEVRKFVDDYEEEVKEKPTPNQTLLRSGVSRLHSLLCEGNGFKSFDDFPITDDVEKKELLSQMRDISRAFKILQDAYKKEK